MDELIREMKEKGLVSIAPLKLRGHAGPVLALLAMMLGTEPMETDTGWWQLRLWLVRN